MESDVVSPPPPIMVSTAAVSTSEGSSSATFLIPRPATIASDNDSHKVGDQRSLVQYGQVSSPSFKVTVAVLPMKPGLTHTVVPRLNTSVFIKATVTNDSQFPLLPGRLAVFMDGSFVTTTDIGHVR